MVTPVAVGIAGMEVVKAQLTQTSNLFTGTLRAYFEFLTKQFTSIGEWILEFDPLNGTYVATFRSTNVLIEISMFRCSIGFNPPMCPLKFQCSMA